MPSAAARLVDSYGRPAASGDGSRLPDVRRQPPTLLSGRYTKKDQFESVVQFHRLGYFQPSTWLVQQMMSASVVASAMQTRCDKLTGTPVQFVPGRNNDEGRRAARQMEEEDAGLIASAPTRAQMLIGGLMQGAKLAQKHWYVSPTSGRGIPQVEPWSNLWVQWDNAAFAYRAWTLAGWKYIESPSMSVPGEAWRPSSTAAALDDPRLWVVSEPFGVKSWEDEMAFVYSLWEPYYGWALSNNDRNFVCEQQGRGQRILKYPKVSKADQPSQDQYISGLIGMGTDAVIPLEQQGRDVEAETAGYSLEAFAYPATGWEIIKGTNEANASAIINRILGHNTQGETKGAAGAGGGAQAGTTIRGDIAVADTLREFVWRYRVHRDWAQWNYGDPGLAPIPLYATEEPLQNVQAGQTAQFMSVALAELDRFGVDTTEYLRRARMPMRIEAQKPGWRPPPKPEKTLPAPDGQPGERSTAAWLEAEVTALRGAGRSAEAGALLRDWKQSIATIDAEWEDK